MKDRIIEAWVTLSDDECFKYVTKLRQKGLTTPQYENWVRRSAAQGQQDEPAEKVKKLKAIIEARDMEILQLNKSVETYKGIAEQNKQLYENEREKRQDLKRKCGELYDQAEHVRIPYARETRDSYEYNCELAPTRTTLEGTKRKPYEDHKTYAKRWRKIVAKVNPPMIEDEIIRTFIKAHDPPYSEELFRMTGCSFAAIVNKFEEYNDFVRVGKIVNVPALKSQLDALQGQGRSGKKPQFKKKEGEVAFIWNQNPTPRPRFQHKPTYSSPYPYYPSPHPVYNTNIPHPRPHPNDVNPPTTPFQISQPNFQQTRLCPTYNPRFSPPNRPTYNYPQPTDTHNQNPTRTFTNLDRPLDQLYEQLKVAGKIGMISPPSYPYGMPVGYNPHATCAYHSGAPGHATANYRLLKHKIQDMLETGEIVIRKREEQSPNMSKNPLPEHTDTVRVIMNNKEFEELVRSMSNETKVFGIMDQPFVIEEASYEEDKKPFILDLTPSESAALEPVVIEFPKQVPVLSLRQVPWNYNEPVLQIGGKQILNEEVSVVTRSGKIASSSTASAPVQLNKMSAQISMLDLLFSSDLHRDALLEVLTKAQIPIDILIDNFSHIVGNVLTAKQITFSDEELPVEGIGHNKALYVAVRCNGKMLAKVLIDNRSALNICPWSTLVKLGLQDVKLRPSETIV
ncbi:uncharacterized protein [Coffea arabica]|uniref:Uncharacterized protein n=1 Tax=Coffea arabica TaxID=13443 RepID=A0A6P6SP28_COFAR